jgi:hypothetical protein
MLPRVFGVTYEDGSSSRCVVCCLEFLELLTKVVAALAVLLLRRLFGVTSVGGSSCHCVVCCVDFLELFQKYSATMTY